MNTSICFGLIFLGGVFGSEWRTSGGDHCTEKCKIGKRKDLQEVFWCPVVHGSRKEYKPEANSKPSTQDPQKEFTDEDKINWDYCTPAQKATIAADDVIEKVTLPAMVNRTKRQSGTGSGDNFNPGTQIIVRSSLPGIDCVGPCTEQSGAKFQCDISGDDPQSFFCSPESVLERIQISSQNMLWCTGSCLKENGSDYYVCKTLFGLDRCSPSADRSAKGETCFSSCKKHQSQYKCHTDDTMTKLDNCGFHKSTEKGLKALEYTVDDQVCASSCEEGTKICKYVEWKWENDQKIANLELKSGSCDLNAKTGTGVESTSIIVFWCIVLAVVIIAAVSFIVIKPYKTVEKKDYTPAATESI